MNPLENFLQEKNAGFFGNIARGFRGTPELGGFGMELGRAAAGAAGTAAIAAAGVGIAKGISALRDAIGYNRDYKAMLSANPSLHKEDASQVQMIYKSLRSLAPTIAKEPLLAASFVRNSLDLSPKEQPKIDLASMKTLAETQDRLGRGSGAILQSWADGGRLQMPSALELGKAQQIQSQMAHQGIMNPMEQEQLRLQLGALPREQIRREREHGWQRERAEYDRIARRHEADRLQGEAQARLNQPQ
jgi:hypothetical protein